MINFEEYERIHEEGNFFAQHYPEDPRKLLRKGIKVPFAYLIEWYKTYGCNNWRKMQGLPLLRKVKR